MPRMSFRPAVEQDRAVRNAVEVEHAGVLRTVSDRPVHLVRQHDQVMALGDFRDHRAVLTGQCAAARVVRRVDDEQLGPRGDQPLQFAHIDPELVAFAQRDRDRDSVGEGGAW
jgi:hypothetical protein